MKILSPAGNLECLKQAIDNGADEVYLGINDFNARNNIDGFTMESLKQAVDYSHIFNVKVCLALNILFSNEEMQSAVETAVKAHNLGVDALIIQDLGLATILNKEYPGIELHASTQMGIHNLEGVRFIEKFGFSRVVLSRETPLSEIKRIRDNSKIEIEYFAHGALCVSFSGNCYLSSYLHGASGNRGRCKQLCRLPYTLKFEDKKIKSGYLLSAKDFNMINRLNDLEKAGVDVIKIEGRARRPFYVASSTRAYFNAINGLSADNTDIQLAFNRGYTEGYFNGNDKIISPHQSHVGIPVGRVEKVKIGKRFNEIYLSSSYPLTPKSTLKLFDGDKELNVLTAFDIKKVSDKTYIVTTTQKVNSGLLVRLITDAQKEQELLGYQQKKMVDITVEAFSGYPLKATAPEYGYTLTDKEIIDKAKSKPLCQKDVSECFNKNEFFSGNITLNTCGNAFVVKSSLNSFRRDFYQGLYEAITKNKKEILTVKKLSLKNRTLPLNDFCIVEDVNEPRKGLNVIYSPNEYSLDKVNEIKEICQKENRKLYLDTPNFAVTKDIELLKEIIKEVNIPIVANNYYALSLTDDYIIGGGLNVFNDWTANVFDKPYITAEWEERGKSDFAYMTLRHCPIKEHVGGDCGKCKYKDGFEYQMQDGKVLKLKRKKLSTCTFYLT